MHFMEFGALKGFVRTSAHICWSNQVNDMHDWGREGKFHVKCCKQVPCEAQNSTPSVPWWLDYQWAGIFQDLCSEIQAMEKKNSGLPTQPQSNPLSDCPMNQVVWAPGIPHPFTIVYSGHHFQCSKHPILISKHFKLFVFHTFSFVDHPVLYHL